MQKKSGITLIELIMGLVIFSIFILSLFNIELFGRFHLFSSQKRARLQNEVSRALEHMTKHLGLAI